MKILVLVFLIPVLAIGVLSAQDNQKKQNKLYDIWTTGGSGLIENRGVLYRVKDSSVVVSDSRYRRDYLTGNLSFTETAFNKISLIQLRRNNSVKRGALIGGIAGFVTGIAGTAIVIKQSGDDFEGFGSLIAGYIGSMMGAAGALIGLVAGSVKISIPINRSQDSFVNSKPKLQFYSYLNQNNNPKTEVNNQIISNVAVNSQIKRVKRINSGYEHGSYIGLLSGPSFPVGGFRNDGSGRSLLLPEIGYSTNLINLGYLIKPNIGISLLSFSNQYEINSTDASFWWGWQGFLVGPMFTFPVLKRVYFDLKPGIGITEITYSAEHQYSGIGIGVNPGASLRYNFAKRWCITTEAGYLYSSSVLGIYGKTGFHAVNLGLGVAYRFR
jgi:hypothetical protein